MTSREELLAVIRETRRKFTAELDKLEDAVNSLNFQPAPTHIPSGHVEEWLTVSEVCKALKISQTTFYEYIKQGELPPGFKFGPHTRRWRMSEINAWQKERQQEREEQAEFLCPIAAKRRNRKL